MDLFSDKWQHPDNISQGTVSRQTVLKHATQVYCGGWYGEVELYQIEK